MFSAPFPLRRILRAALWACAVFVALALGFTALLPTLASTRFARDALERAASAKLKRAVTIGDLRWGWNSGISLADFSISDAPPSKVPLAAIGKITVDVKWTALLSGALDLSAGIKGFEANLVRARDGRTNLEALLTDLSPEKPAGPAEKPETQGGETRLPDAKLYVTFDDINISYVDGSTGEAHRLERGSLELSAVTRGSPSFAVKFGGEVSGLGKEVIPISAEASVTGFADPGGLPTPLNSSGFLKARLPGAQFDARGDATKAKLEAKIEVGELLPVVAPLLPSSAAPLKGMGALSLKAEGTRGEGDMMSYSFGIKGENLSLKGKLTGGGEVGLKRLLLSLEGVANRNTGSLTVASGVVSLPGLEAKFSGGLETKDGEKSISFRVSGVDADLPALLSAAGPLLAEGTRLRPTGGQNRMRAENISGAFSLPSKDAELSVGGLSLEVDGLSGASGNHILSASGLAFSASKVTATLKNGELGGASGELRCSLSEASHHAEGRSAISGFSTALAFDVSRRDNGNYDVELPTFDLHLASASAAPYGAVSSISFSARDLSAKGVGRNGTATVASKSLDFSLGSSVGAAGDAAFSAEGVKVGLDSLELTLDHGVPSRISLGCELELAGLELLRPQPARVGDLKLKASSLRFTGSRESGIELSLPSLAVEAGALSAHLPGTGKTASASLRKARLGVDGAAFSLDGKLSGGAFNLDRLTLSADSAGTDVLGGAAEATGVGLSLERVSVEKFKVDPRALLGVRGNLALKEKLKVESLEMKGEGGIEGLAQSLEAALTLDDIVQIKFGDFSIASKEVTIRREPPLRIPGAKVEAQGNLSLASLTPLNLDINSFEAQARVTDAALLRVSARARSSGRKSLSIQADASTDLERLFSLLPASIRLPVSEGKLNASFGFNGRIPEEADVLRAARLASRLPFDHNELSDSLGFIDKLKLEVNFSELAGEYSATGKSLEFRASTASPLVAEAGPALSDLRASGGITARVEQDLLPQFGKSAEARAKFVFSENDWDRCDFNAAFSVDSDAEAAASVRGRVLNLRTLFPLREIPSLATVLQQLSAQMEGEVDLAASQRISLPDGASFSGRAAARAKVELDRGRELRLEGGSTLERVNLSGLQGVKISNLSGEFSVEKAFALGPREGARRVVDELLSQAVLKPVPEEAEERSTTLFTRRGAREKPSITADLVEIPGVFVPLRLSDTAVWLSFDGILPIVDAFSLEAFEGSVRGSLRPAKTSDGYSVVFSSVFSDLNVAGLSGRPAFSLPPEETLVSGRVDAVLPLSPVWQRVVEETLLDLRITKLGGKALDSVLFALERETADRSVSELRRKLDGYTLEWLAVELRSGLLSARGRASLKGVSLDLPPLERVPVARTLNLPAAVQGAARLGPLIETLDVVTSHNLEMVLHLVSREGSTN